MNEKKRVIALGFFDGVHRGHGALLSRVGEVARETGYIPAAFTFDAHPASCITGATTPLINTATDRADLMARCYGIQEVMVGHFDKRMMEQPWDQFITETLMGQYNAGHVVAGHDFHFGYKGEGNPERLQSLCQQLGIGCDIMSKVTLEGITISSTYIRTLVAQGEMERAGEFLGHPHTLTATVTHGKKLGSKLGFPTVNLPIPKGILVPPHGVYATKIYLPDGRDFMAVTNVGVRPTVETAGGVNVEGYLLDFDGDLYGQSLRVEFYLRLRGEKRFDSLDDLRDEIAHNEQETRTYFNG